MSVLNRCRGIRKGRCRNSTLWASGKGYDGCCGAPKKTSGAFLIPDGQGNREGYSLMSYRWVRRGFWRFATVKLRPAIRRVDG